VRATSVVDTDIWCVDKAFLWFLYNTSGFLFFFHFFQSCTVHLDTVKVFYLLTDAQ
jgi:hypothetical protein